MNPVVTVGIPFFNERRFLATAVQSILRQSFRDLEILLVDDGSTDESVHIARSFDDPRVRVLTDGRRRHLAARLNEITRAAQGRFIARMDADDVAHPERLARQLAVLDRETCDACGSWVGLVDGDDAPFAIVEATSGPVPPRVALERGVIPHPTLIARREWFVAHPYDETLSRTEDRDLWFRTAPSTRFEVVPEPLYVMRVIAREATFLPKYIEAQRQNRTLFRRYGPATLGWPWVARAMASAHAKSAAMRVATQLGAAEWLVRRRGRPPTTAEVAMIAEILAASR